MVRVGVLPIYEGAETMKLTESTENKLKVNGKELMADCIPHTLG